MKKIALFISLLILLFSCRTVKVDQQQPHASVKSIKSVEVLDSMLLKNSQFSSMNISKLTVDIYYSDQHFSTKAFVKLLQDSLIQLSVQPFMGIEVGRMQITPTEIIVIDRFHSQYCRTNAAQLKEMTGFDFDFYMLQSLLSNKLFSEDNLPSSHLTKDKFVIVEFPNGYEINAKEPSDAFRTAFIVNPQYQIEKTTIIHSKYTYSLSCEYSNFVQIGAVDFPQKMKFSVFDGRRQNQLELTVTKVEFDAPMNLSFSIPQKYQEIETLNFNF
jgi:hypothetical protein